jgi:RHS repeat-associated protein
VTDENDNVVQTLDYYPYGSLHISSGTSTNERRKFIGQFSDDSGLNYLQARYQDPQRGQFISEDPVFLAIGGVHVDGADRQSPILRILPQSPRLATHCGGTALRLTCGSAVGDDAFHTGLLAGSVSVRANFGTRPCFSIVIRVAFARTCYDSVGGCFFRCALNRLGTAVS